MLPPSESRSSAFLDVSSGAPLFPNVSLLASVAQARLFPQSFANLHNHRPYHAGILLLWCSARTQTGNLQRGPKFFCLDRIIENYQEFFLLVPPFLPAPIRRHRPKKKKTRLFPRNVLPLFTKLAAARPRIFVLLRPPLAAVHDPVAH
jgi:hypothetical protein